MILVLDGPFGPNSCSVSHDPAEQRIFVESKHKLLIEGMREIESYLNLDMLLGQRWMIAETPTPQGFITIWSYLEAFDCDWS